MSPEQHRTPEERDLAEQPLDDLDLSILACMQDLYTDVDPVPRELATEIKFALTVQALHAEVAELQLAESDALVRSDDFAQTETMTFSCDQLSAMITVTAVDADTVRVDGWVTTSGCEVELRIRALDGGTEPTLAREQADADGRFTFTQVSKGMAQLVFRSAPTDDPDAAPARPVITPHVEI